MICSDVLSLPIGEFLDTHGPHATIGFEANRVTVSEPGRVLKKPIRMCHRLHSVAKRQFTREHALPCNRRLENLAVTINRQDAAGRGIRVPPGAIAYLLDFHGLAHTQTIVRNCLARPCRIHGIWPQTRPHGIEIHDTFIRRGEIPDRRAVGILREQGVGIFRPTGKNAVDAREGVGVQCGRHVV